MRLAVIAPGYAPDVGGVETVVTRLSEALSALSVEVEVWAPQRGLRRETSHRRGDIVVRRFPATRSTHYSMSTALWQHVRSAAKDFDLIHAHGYHSSAALALLGLSDRPPYVFSPHYHGVGHTAPARLLHKAYAPAGRRLIANAAAVVAVSAAESARLTRDFPTLAPPTVIHHGVDAASLRQAEPFAAQPNTVLVVGRLEAYKRIETVIHAFDGLDDRAQLVVLGDGPHRARLESVAARARRCADIKILGSVCDTDVRRWMRTAHVVVNMSEQEAFGLVGLEGAAAGAHVVLSDLPAHREVAALARGATEMVEADPSALRTALRGALGRPRLQPADVRGWDVVAQDYLDLFARVLNLVRESA